jgi:hypothetical protein
MKAWIWLRMLAGVLAFFTIGHTIGFLSPPKELQAAAVAETMRSVRFDVMGSDRSYWDFYRGFGLFLSVNLAMGSVIAWQLSGISRRSPRQALPMTITLDIVCVASTLLSWWFFFAAPLGTSLAAVCCATIAVVCLKREALMVESARERAHA